MKTRPYFFCVISIVFSFISCNNMNSNDKLVSDTIVNNKMQKNNTDSIKTAPIPDSFLDLKLGAPFSEFIANHPNAHQQEDDFFTFDLSLMGCVIYFDDMERPYILDNFKTKSGDELEIRAFFFNDRLAAIYVEYKNGVYVTDKVYSAFNDKYGDPTYSEVKSEYHNTKSYYWIAKSCVLNFLYKSDIGDLFLVFADRAVQDKIVDKRKNKNSESIE